MQGKLSYLKGTFSLLFYSANTYSLRNACISAQIYVVVEGSSEIHNRIICQYYILYILYILWKGAEKKRKKRGRKGRKLWFGATLVQMLNETKKLSQNQAHPHQCKFSLIILCNTDNLLAFLSFFCLLLAVCLRSPAHRTKPSFNAFVKIGRYTQAQHGKAVIMLFNIV